MSDFKASFFVLRTPLLPWADLEPVLAAPDAATGRARLLEAATRAEVREAIAVASPDLEAGLGQRADEVAEPLLRYFARMCGRPTPFGLFAGCSVGRTGERTRLALEDGAAARRRSRLDTDLVAALADALGREPALRARLRFRPGSSLHRAASRLRYVEARIVDGARRHRLVAIDPDPVLELVLDRARDGARMGELREALLASDPDLGPAEVEAYLGELADAQVLVPELELPVTGREPVEHLVACLRPHPEAAAAVAALDEASRALGKLDRSGLGSDPDAYRKLASLFSGLPVKVDPARLVQVDLHKSSPRATMETAVLGEILAGVELLHRLQVPAPDPLDEFRRAFAARYEEREVPLVEVLDEESGIGLESSGASDPSPLLAGLTLAPPGQPGYERAVPSGRTAVLLSLVERALRSGEAEVALTTGDIDALERAARESGEARPLPGAFAAFASIAARSPDDLDRGRFRVLVEHAHGPSGAELLGRFCLGDEELAGHVLRHLRAEEALHPDCVLAEVVHLPEGRMGNILLRPCLRRHEIPYLAAPGVAREDVIPVTDLRVRVVGSEVQLRSARLGKRVLPRLTSAHNFHRRSLVLYRFLCTLQAQGVAAGVGWSWGALDAAPFLPRVTSGRLVLARARWLIDGETCKALRRMSEAERQRAVARLREERRIPRHVLLAEGDNELPVDLASALSVASFLGAARGAGPHALCEMFPPADALCAEGPEGRFVHQVIVPFVSTRPPEKAAAPPLGAAAFEEALPPVRRTFAPGSEWLYVKLYGGEATADWALLDLVAPLVSAARREGSVDRWFFLRYADPGSHLRVRLHGDPSRLLGEVLPWLHLEAEPWLADGRLHRIQLDTYEREVERYGGAGAVEIAESLFEADSDTVLEVLPLVLGDSGLGVRSRLALAGADRLLDDFGLGLEARLRALASVRRSFAREHGLDKQGKRLGERLRQERPALEELRAGRAAAASPLALGLAAWERRSARVRPLARGLRALGLDLEDLALSFVHMHVNRLVRSTPRAHEAVIYDFLWHLDESRRVRARAVPA